jgi:hypothetical protein
MTSPAPNIFVCDVSDAFDDDSWLHQHCKVLDRALAAKAWKFVQKRDQVRMHDVWPFHIVMRQVV